MYRSSEAAPPRTVLTVGMHGSASTWVFNAARELMAASCGADEVAAGYAAHPEEMAALPIRPGQHLLVKTHGWPELPAFARQRAAAVIVSVRDPRDAVLSLMQRFGDLLDVAASGVRRDCRCARSCAAAGHHMLRYEDGFFDDPAAVRQIAAQLGIPVADADADRIFRAYRTEAVRELAAAVPSLPPARRRGDGERVIVDRLTLVTHTHIGDGRIGKWRDAFDAEVQGKLTRFFAPFLIRFGYPLG